MAWIQTATIAVLILNTVLLRKRVEKLEDRHTRLNDATRKHIVGR